jgi:hypothetical protein
MAIVVMATCRRYVKTSVEGTADIYQRPQTEGDMMPELRLSILKPVNPFRHLSAATNFMRSWVCF